eukprot:3256271-Amphidinium_carterae.1
MHVEQSRSKTCFFLALELLKVDDNGCGSHESSALKWRGMMHPALSSWQVFPCTWIHLSSAQRRKPARTQ